MSLAACHPQDTRDTINAMDEADNSAVQRASSAPPSAFSVNEKSALLHFAYEWPAEAAAVPALAERFQRERALAKRDANDAARGDQAARRLTGSSYFAHEFTRSWSTAGQSADLLSLVATTSVFTGGAHPNHGSSALLWDRKTGREIKLDALFASPARLTAILTGPWCKAIAAARAGRRVGQSVGDLFDECPPLSDLAIVPADSDRDGRFDRLRLLADPYVAGPYAEGDYEVDFALEPKWIAAMKPGWRASFESQPQ